MAKQFNKDHPERKDGEVFVGNTNHYGFQNIGYTSKRRGVQAYYDEIGTPYQEDREYFPIFASSTEVKEHNPEVYDRLVSREEQEKNK